ncbi:Uu.00g000960.m01.CDS01 [Anthostomella pinea]|uniref:Uu.00g000960.m01.CDS01 n=1 Tax=Anthostomella pinea TaxID=933095 RepID=A0AAI8VK06_9PEZI|nr:Uu.00g000960.m01.CDS01 [Anthostomella pinea]
MAAHGPGGGGGEDVELYELLGVDKSASANEIKKAYRKLALQHHPDKVAEELRPEAEATFKSVTQAYEILRDDEKREMYDKHGMAAFDPSRGGGMGEEVDINDILSQMFGMGGGMGGMGGGGGGPRRPRRGADEESRYSVTLEDLYKGKTVKFAADKQTLCGTCKGSGAKEKVKPQQCDRCKGAGVVEAFRQVGPGLVTRESAMCDRCHGSGNNIKEKDRCKKCKGKRTVQERKPLEIYIPRGAYQGERIVLEGEADQQPDQTPGDLVFVLVEEPHDVFNRIGNDLSANMEITLAESLCGFSRVVLQHLDGRGVHITHPRGKILRPGQVLKVEGEGMPLKRGEAKGDLYLMVKIAFPEDGWLQDDAAFESLQKLLPNPAPVIKAEEVDEVDYNDDADIDEMGANSDDPRFGGEGWEDDDDEAAGQPQCAQQ